MYVTRLPLDTTREELVERFSRCGVLEEDVDELRARFGETLPRAVLKRLLEIDWVQDNHDCGTCCRMLIVMPRL